MLDPTPWQVHRFGLAVTAAVMFAVGLVDVYRVLAALGAPHCAPLCLPHARLPLVLFEMASSFGCLFALILTYVPNLTRIALRVVVVGYVQPTNDVKKYVSQCRVFKRLRSIGN